MLLQKELRRQNVGCVVLRRNIVSSPPRPKSSNQEQLPCIVLIVVLHLRSVLFM